MIDASKITTLLENDSIEIRVFDVIDSTNTYLKQHAFLPMTPVACIAETQTQGRGRFNRNWHSPKGENIYLSLSYYFNKSVQALSGLSLMVGLSVCKAIEAVCELPVPLMVKWPNDIMACQKKLGGILIEIYQTQATSCQVIIGIGLNVNMEQTHDAAILRSSEIPVVSSKTSAPVIHAQAGIHRENGTITQSEIDSRLRGNDKPRELRKSPILQAWTSLRLLTNTAYDRNPLCAKLLDTLKQDLQHFEQHGFSYFNEAWHKKDMLYHQEITLLYQEKIIKGIGAGINEQGHLLLNLPNHSQQAFVSGEASLLK